MVAEAQIILI